jgi:hypothetical protein
MNSICKFLMMVAGVIVSANALLASGEKEQPTITFWRNGRGELDIRGVDAEFSNHQKHVLYKKLKPILQNKEIIEGKFNVDVKNSNETEVWREGPYESDWKRLEGYLSMSYHDLQVNQYGSIEDSNTRMSMDMGYPPFLRRKKLSFILNEPTDKGALSNAVSQINSEYAKIENDERKKQVYWFIKATEAKREREKGREAFIKFKAELPERIVSYGLGLIFNSKKLKDQKSNQEQTIVSN